MIRQGAALHIVLPVPPCMASHSGHLECQAAFIFPWSAHPTASTLHSQHTHLVSWAVFAPAGLTAHPGHLP